MTILGYAVTDLFLYFIFYSFLGWVMETCYCSICERRLVPRGFLYGPICPIYGAGVLLMILFFTPLKQNLLLFYVVAVVVMSSWEYFVAWLLETTTHVKYWDYSHFRFNLKGRICLWVALVWGVLSYLVIFYIHPPVEELFAMVDRDIEANGQWFDRVAIGREWVLGDDVSSIPRIRGVFSRDEVKVRVTGNRRQSTRIVELWIVDDRRQLQTTTLRSPSELQMAVTCLRLRVPEARFGGYESMSAFTGQTEEEWQARERAFRRRREQRLAGERQGMGNAGHGL